MRLDLLVRISEGIMVMYEFQLVSTWNILILD